ncbi:MAG: iron ABC transporter substrate-binding protein [Desulfobacter sp.]|nr:iron ABC transporter substrate-binding protein [Desulfobacter sp.]WDP84788.1 MAG: iron ABC transporter substrate-binding protein [Desulfobacter sp.]
MKKLKYVLWIVVILFSAGSAAAQEVTDARGRTLTLPDRVERIICSGPGCLRLVAYLGAQDLVVGVDDIETRQRKFDARPYAFANKDFRSLPVFGGFRGQDDPEKILGLDPMPQVIFKTFNGTGCDPDELWKKTRIPVVVLEYGDLGQGRSDLFASIDLMGKILDKQPRALEVIDFFKGEIQALADRSLDMPEKKTCFIGGIAFKGPHGFHSTEPCYPPFEFVNGLNIAGKDRPLGKALKQTLFSKEEILEADPAIIFVDLSTLQMGEGHGGLFELKTDPIYQALTAVQKNQVFGVLPYNWYSQNFGSILADAWYAGKILYPDRFKEIDPVKEADRIYSFLLSVPVFEQMNALFEHKVFTRLDLEK